jgi:hypothetical protein
MLVTPKDSYAGSSAGVRAAPRPPLPRITAPSGRSIVSPNPVGLNGRRRSVISLAERRIDPRALYPAPRYPLFARRPQVLTTTYLTSSPRGRLTRLRLPSHPLPLPFEISNLQSQIRVPVPLSRRPSFPPLPLKPQAAVLLNPYLPALKCLIPRCSASTKKNSPHITDSSTPSPLLM